MSSLPVSELAQPPYPLMFTQFLNEILHIYGNPAVAFSQIDQEEKAYITYENIAAEITSRFGIKDPSKHREIFIKLGHGASRIEAATFNEAFQEVVEDRQRQEVELLHSMSLNSHVYTQPDCNQQQQYTEDDFNPNQIPQEIPQDSNEYTEESVKRSNKNHKQEANQNSSNPTEGSIEENSQQVNAINSQIASINNNNNNNNNRNNSRHTLNVQKQNGSQQYCEEDSENHPNILVEDFDSGDAFVRVSHRNEESGLEANLQHDQQGIQYEQQQYQQNEFEFDQQSDIILNTQNDDIEDSAYASLSKKLKEQPNFNDFVRSYNSFDISSQQQQQQQQQQVFTKNPFNNTRVPTEVSSNNLMVHQQQQQQQQQPNYLFDSLFSMEKRSNEGEKPSSKKSIDQLSRLDSSMNGGGYSNSALSNISPIKLAQKSNRNSNSNVNSIFTNPLENQLRTIRIAVIPIDKEVKKSSIDGSSTLNSSKGFLSGQKPSNGLLGSSSSSNGFFQGTKKTEFILSSNSNMKTVASSRNIDQNRSTSNLFASSQSQLETEVLPSSIDKLLQDIERRKKGGVTNSISNGGATTANITTTNNNTNSSRYLLQQQLNDVRRPVVIPKTSATMRREFTTILTSVGLNKSSQSIVQMPKSPQQSQQQKPSSTLTNRRLDTSNRFQDLLSNLDGVGQKKNPLPRQQQPVGNKRLNEGQRQATNLSGWMTNDILNSLQFRQNRTQV